MSIDTLMDMVKLVLLPKKLLNIYHSDTFSHIFEPGKREDRNLKVHKFFQKLAIYFVNTQIQSYNLMEFCIIVILKDLHPHIKTEQKLSVKCNLLWDTKEE